VDLNKTPWVNHVPRSQVIAGATLTEGPPIIPYEKWSAPGVAVRAVLRHRIALAQRALTPDYQAIGTGLVNEPALARGTHLPPDFADAVASARADLVAATDERVRRLAGLGGSAVPAWTGREGTALGRAIWDQLRPQLFPRASVLAGLTVGWWVTQTYTDSHWRSTLNSIGIGHGGTHLVSSGTYRAMSFWLPLLAAALCAYVGDRVAHAVRQRYGIAKTDATQPTWNAERRTRGPKAPDPQRLA
jgi:hypothetical protein